MNVKYITVPRIHCSVYNPLITVYNIAILYIYIYIYIYIYMLKWMHSMFFWDRYIHIDFLIRMECKYKRDKFWSVHVVLINTIRRWNKNRNRYTWSNAERLLGTPSSTSRKRDRRAHYFKSNLFIWETYNYKEHTKRMILQLYMWSRDQ